MVAWMRTSTNNMASTDSKSRQQVETDEYLSKYKLKEIFQGLLRQVIVNQPSDPFRHFHEEISKIKKEISEENIDVASSTFLTTQFPSTEHSDRTVLND